MPYIVEAEYNGQYALSEIVRTEKQAKKRVSKGIRLDKVIIFNDYDDSKSDYKLIYRHYRYRRITKQEKEKIEERLRKFWESLPTTAIKN